MLTRERENCSQTLKYLYVEFKEIMTFPKREQTVVCPKPGIIVTYHVHMLTFWLSKIHNHDDDGTQTDTIEKFRRKSCRFEFFVVTNRFSIQQLSHAQGPFAWILHTCCMNNKPFKRLICLINQRSSEAIRFSSWIISLDAILGRNSVDRTSRSFDHPDLFSTVQNALCVPVFSTLIEYLVVSKGTHTDEKRIRK